MCSSAYVIYTSGSTGKPKGVMIEHRNLVNLCRWHCETFEVRAASRCSSAAAFGFDAAVWEMWPPLCVGATLVLAPAAVAGDPWALLNWWASESLDVSFLTTPVAELAFSEGIGNPQLRVLLVGGDRLRRRPPSRRFGGPSLVNNYGPTESTVVATSGRIDDADPVLHIGRPIANTRIYILGEQRELLPVGAVGEIYIGGAGVARGYLNRPELTAERFLCDPFADEPGARMYRSGDLARWLPDGNIEFLGRADMQVKIRGYRIETGEIEARLDQHPRIEESVVVAQGQQGERYLVGCYVSDDGGELSAQELREHLQQSLPEFMLPSVFVCLQSIPLTANGKIDRRSLEQMPVQRESSADYVAPRNATEAELVQIWAQLLNVAAGKIGVHDNFFELGGHSLLATRLISKIRSQLGVEVPLKAIFNANTIAHVAEAVLAIQRQHQSAFEEPEDADLELEDGSL